MDRKLILAFSLFPFLFGLSCQSAHAQWYYNVIPKINKNDFKIHKDDFYRAGVPKINRHDLKIPRLPAPREEYSYFGDPVPQQQYAPSPQYPQTYSTNFRPPQQVRPQVQVRPRARPVPATYAITIRNATNRILPFDAGATGMGLARYSLAPGQTQSLTSATPQIAIRYDVDASPRTNVQPFNLATGRTWTFLDKGNLLNMVPDR